jgi:hypothetical protein
MPTAQQNGNKTFDYFLQYSDTAQKQRELELHLPHFVESVVVLLGVERLQIALKQHAWLVRKGDETRVGLAKKDNTRP